MVRQHCAHVGGKTSDVYRFGHVEARQQVAGLRWQVDACGEVRRWQVDASGELNQRARIRGDVGAAGQEWIERHIDSFGKVGENLQNIWQRLDGRGGWGCGQAIPELLERLR